MRTAKNDRDPSFERLLRDTLRTQAACGRPDPCLDADTVAAWLDDSLPARDRAAAESHVADCARCQALLAAVAKATPVSAGTSWWRGPLVFKWLVPLTAVATAVVVWVAVPSRSKLETGNVPASAVATVARAPEEKIDQSLRDAQPAPERRTRGARQALSSPPLVRPSSEPLERKEREAPPAKPAADRNDTAFAAPAAVGAVAPAATTAAVAPAAPAPNISDQVSRQQPAPVAAARPAEGVATANPAAGAAPAKAAAEAAAAPAAPVAAPATAVRPAGVATLARAFRAAQDILVVSPDSRRQWRVSAGGVVQRSTDGGSTWQAQQTGVQTPLMAGVSPSPTVCWLVGAGGTVLLSTDGRSWRRVAFPEMTDLTAIRATDARTATVTASDGRTFGTTDGGQTWAR